jgi:uracil-DNA glycosylase
LHVEVKYRERHTAYSLYKLTKDKAIEESKVPVVILTTKNKHEQLVVADIKDIPQIAKELTKAKIEANGIDPNYLDISTHSKNKWDSYYNRWKDCEKCSLHRLRNNTVHLRGRLPCNILFIMDIPGHTEDKLAYPLVASPGLFFDICLTNEFAKLNSNKIILKNIGKLTVLTTEEQTITYAIANVMGCIPKNTSNKCVRPTNNQINTCLPRINELIEICAPNIIVRLGRFTQETITPTNNQILTFDLAHPITLFNNRNPTDIENFQCQLASILQTFLKQHYGKVQ